MRAKLTIPGRHTESDKQVSGTHSSLGLLISADEQSDDIVSEQQIPST